MKTKKVLFAILIMLITLLLLNCPTPSSSPNHMDNGTYIGNEKGKKSLVTGDREIRIVNNIPFAFRYVSPGSYNRLYHLPDNSSKLELITVDKGFWISETEVTQELYQSIMGQNDSLFVNSPANGERQEKRPVDYHTILHAIVFCNALSQLDGKEPFYKVNGIDDWSTIPNGIFNDLENRINSGTSSGNGYRIPFEYEWDWAALGADLSGFGKDGYKKHYSGDTIGSIEGMEDYVWCYENSNSITHEVGLKNPNEIGLFDMTGNVNERFLYPNSNLKSGITGNSITMWKIDMHNHLFSTMNFIHPYNRDPEVGIRLVFY